MLEDIVLDTNVLVHSQNPNEPRFNHSNTLLQCLLDASTNLCVDNGFDVEQSKNRSLIGGEYLEHVQIGSLAYAFLVQIAMFGRIKQVNRMPQNRHRRMLNQLIRKPRDRTFISVAINSQDKILVSHDYEDFQTNKRRTIKDKCDVMIIEAGDCIVFLASV